MGPLPGVVQIADKAIQVAGILLNRIATVESAPERREQTASLTCPRWSLDGQIFFGQHALGGTRMSTYSDLSDP